MKRIVALLVLVGAAAFLAGGGLGCGGSATQPKVGSYQASKAPLRDGTWRLVTVVTMANPGPQCAAYEMTMVDTLHIVNGEPGYFGSGCVFTITGSTFTQTCVDTALVNGTCVVFSDLNGSGSFSSTTFSGIYTLGWRDSPTGCSASWGITICARHVTVTGTRLSTPSLAPTVSGLRGALSRVLQEHVPGPARRDR